jgi:hypothetical protein
MIIYSVTKAWQLDCQTCIYCDYRNVGSIDDPRCTRHAPVPKYAILNDEDYEEGAEITNPSAFQLTCGDGKWLFNGYISSKEEILETMVDNPESSDLEIYECGETLNDHKQVVKEVYPEDN